jgi:HEPN domain-containing protein
MKPATQEWLELGQTDLHAASALCEDEALTAVVAFHCQQAVEKAFKAIIEERSLRLPKTHDLQRLLGIVQQAVHLELDGDQLDVLNQVYVSSRYPMDLGIFPSGRPSLEEARQIHAFAEQVFSEVASLLRQR